MDAGRLFYTDSTSAMKKDHMVPVLKSFTQVCRTHQHLQNLLIIRSSCR